MELILLEAFAALAVLGAIVWWTMFAGRRGGERRVGLDAPQQPAACVPPPSVTAAKPTAGAGKIPPPG